MLNRNDFSAYFNNSELLAGKFLEYYFQGSLVYPIDPFKVLTGLGVPFSFRDFSECEGMYLPAENEDDIPVVGINRNRPITRQRFTAAHELCHHIKDSYINRLCPQKDYHRQDAIEKFAENFAAAFLMPLKELRDQVSLYEKDGYIAFDDVLKVADYFVVSFDSCVFRIAYKLRKIDGDTDAKKLRMRINQYRPSQRRGLLNLQNYEIDAIKNVLDQAIAQFIYNESLAVKYKFKNDFVYNENRLEGLDIDKQTVAEIITDLRLNKQDSEFCKDEYNTVVEVAGHAAIYDHIINNRDETLSVFKLLELNRILFQYAPYPEAGGKTRTLDTLVLGAKFETVRYQDIPLALTELDRKVKEVIASIDSMSMCDYIDEVIKIHHRITVIHPFPEGNGRTSRGFLNWMFILKGIPPVYLPVEKKNEYIDALRIADLTGDYTQLRKVFYNAVISSYLELSNFPGL